MKEAAEMSDTVNEYSEIIVKVLQQLGGLRYLEGRFFSPTATLLSTRTGTSITSQTAQFLTPFRVLKRKIESTVGDRY